MTVAEQISIACDHCGKATDKPKLPPGWRRHNGVWCADCWSKAWVCRAVTVPVAEPIGETWDDFGSAVRTSWRLAAMVANWTTRRMALAETPRLPGDKKIHPMVRDSEIYRDGTASFPECPTGTLTAIQHAAQNKYRAQRFEIWWRQERSLPNNRYPTPWPVRGSDWNCQRGPSGDIQISCPLAPKKRWTFSLATGSARPRQRAALQHMLDGDWLCTEMSLFGQRAAGNQRGNTTAKSAAGAKQGGRVRVMCKIVLWMPRKQPKDAAGVLRVHTGEQYLLAAFDDKKERIWTLHADHLRRWQAEHSRRLDRLSDDRKAETRMPSDRAKVWREMLEKHTTKHHRRMSNGLHGAARQLVNYAARRNFQAVELDATNRAFSESFPWSTFIGIMGQKCEEVGVEFIEMGQAPKDEPVAL